MYQLVNFFILINLLIAMMTTTIGIIYKNRNPECKMARTKIWMQYFDKFCNVPPPFNFLEMLFRRATMKSAKCCSGTENETPTHSVLQERYKER